MSSEVNTTLKVWRAKFDFTQQDVADKIGVTRKTINTIERGIYTPSTALALRIAKLFETTVEDIFSLKEE